MTIENHGVDDVSEAAAACAREEAATVRTFFLGGPTSVSSCGSNVVGTTGSDI